jgi:hypothetical protein
MTRTAARQLAIQLCLPQARSDRVRRVFEENTFTRFLGGRASFSEMPDDRRALYLRSGNGVGENGRSWTHHSGTPSAEALPLSRRPCASPCALYEILYMPDIPPAAAHQRAVELARL